MTGVKIQLSGAAGYFRAESIRVTDTNRAASVLELVNLAPEGSTSPIAGDDFFSRGSAVCLQGRWINIDVILADEDGHEQLVRIFRGIITRARRNIKRGTEVANLLEAKSGWYFLERIPYAQKWKHVPDGATEAVQIQSTRVVLNQDSTGESMTAWQQINDILAFAKTVSTYSPITWVDETIGATEGSRLATTTLPFDEARDLTCAQALERILRFFPDISVAFEPQYKQMVFRSGAGPHDAAVYVDGYAGALALTDELTDAWINGVRIEIERTGNINGTPYRRIDLQTAGETAGINKLNATLELAGASSTRTRQRIDVVVEPFGDPTSPTWWVSRCPAVFGNTGAADITINTVVRSGEADKASYPNITATPIVDLEAAGLLARKEIVTCWADITRRDAAGDVVEVEKNVCIRVELVTTNANTRTYTYTTAQSSSTGEPVPAGLAAAMLEARSNDGRAVSVTLDVPTRYDIFGLLDSFTHGPMPEVGDSYQGLVAQSVEYLFPQRTINVQFGPPEHLSAQDMVGMMTGFRARKTTSVSAVSRSTGEIDHGDEIQSSIIAPAATVQAGTGLRERLKVAVAAGASIDADPAQITDADKDMKPRQITVCTVGPDDTLQARKLWVMATGGIDDGPAKPAGGLPDGTEIPGRVDYDDSSATPKFVQYKLKWDAATGQFVELAVPTAITDLVSHTSQHPSDYIPPPQ